VREPLEKARDAGTVIDDLVHRPENLAEVPP
jgi:hypothetical protein